MRRAPLFGGALLHFRRVYHITKDGGLSRLILAHLKQIFRFFHLFFEKTGTKQSRLKDRKRICMERQGKGSMLKGTAGMGYTMIKKKSNHER